MRLYIFLIVIGAILITYSVLKIKVWNRSLPYIIGVCLASYGVSFILVEYIFPPLTHR